MVEVTIKTDFEGGGAVHKMAPANLAVVTCISPAGDNECHSHTGIVGGDGLGDYTVAGALAGSTVQVLMEIAGHSRKKQAKILMKYMEAFLVEAADKAGEKVLDMVVDIMEESE